MVDECGLCGGRDCFSGSLGTDDAARRGQHNRGEPFLFWWYQSEAGMGGTALPAQHAPLTDLSTACGSSSRQPVQTVSWQGLSLDTAAHPAFA